MKHLNKKLMLGVVVGCGFLFSQPVQATITIIWSEDFSNVTDWQVITDPGGGSSITTDGSLGLFQVPSANNFAAFGPISIVAPLVAFDIAYKINYSMNFTVASLTDSTSYDIRLDEFDSNTNYVNTVFGIHTQGTFTGTTNVLLGNFSYDAGTVFLLPKITVFTGNGDQTVRFDSLDFDVIVPEPSVAILLMVGFGMMWHRRSQR